MTIAALVRGRAMTYNALVVDTGAVRSDGFIADHDKLHRVFGDTYLTCVGDATLLPILLSSAKASKRRPNLRDSGFISSLFSELQIARKSGLVLGVPTAFPATTPPCTILAVCNREQAFFWKVNFDVATDMHVIPTAPTFLEPNSMIVLRGVTVATLEGFTTVDAANAEEVIVDQMINVNAEIEKGAGAEKLPYQMKRRVSGIILPHKTSDAATRIDPGVPPMPMRGLT